MDPLVSLCGEQNLGERGCGLIARPVPLQFTKQLHPADWFCAGFSDALQRGPMRFDRRTADGVHHRSTCAFILTAPSLRWMTTARWSSSPRRSFSTSLTSSPRSDSRPRPGLRSAGTTINGSPTRSAMSSPLPGDIFQHTKRLPEAERHFTANAWALGDGFSAADVVLGATCVMARFVGLLEGLPAVRARPGGLRGL